MQLSSEFKLALDHESSRLGISALELAAKITADSEKAIKRERDDPDKKLKSGKTLTEYIAWIRMRNPGVDSYDPLETDWQAIKAEGRRY